MKADYLGIDPGLNGAFAIVSGDRVQYKMVMPTLGITTKKGKTKTEIDRRGTLSFLKMFPLHIHVAIEQQEAFRKQNITSICTTCKNYGILLMGLTATHMLVTEVLSDVWQAHFNILPVTKADGKSTKEQALEVVKGIYPDTDFRKSDQAQKPHDGIVDAVLIANYCQFLFEEGK